ncbi:conserved hypothetical protein [Agrobacterium fabrum str. J-07]|nr:conserved hypothetical protein [Agrobacterium fabrum str. J-07]
MMITEPAVPVTKAPAKTAASTTNMNPAPRPASCCVTCSVASSTRVILSRSLSSVGFMFDGGFVAIHTSFASIPFRPAASQVEGNLQKDCYIAHIFPKEKTGRADVGEPNSTLPLFGR